MIPRAAKVCFAHDSVNLQTVSPLIFFDRFNRPAAIYPVNITKIKGLVFQPGLYFPDNASGGASFKYRCVSFRSQLCNGYDYNIQGENQRQSDTYLFSGYQNKNSFVLQHFSVIVRRSFIIYSVPCKEYNAKYFLLHHCRCIYGLARVSASTRIFPKLIKGYTALSPALLCLTETVPCSASLSPTTSI